ncbi:MAG: SigE family RNA polymerase sigma factor [Acidimicrobiia bacterium]
MRPGNADAVLGGLFRAQYEPLVGLARLLVDDRGHAEEVVQEAFARAYASWPRLRDQDDPLPYVRRAVVNLARGGLRRRRTVRRTRLTPVPDIASAESAAVARERVRTVASAVRALPRRQRECVVLRYYLDCSTIEAATTLGISEGSVKQHLHRALAALGLVLEKEEHA